MTIAQDEAVQAVVMATPKTEAVQYFSDKHHYTSDQSKRIIEECGETQKFSDAQQGV